MAQTDNENKFLQLLSVQFPTINSAAAEIINLSSMLNLPKGTEHFISDIHGEYPSFQHVLKNGSGSIAKKLGEEFGTSLTQKEKRALATLIYYPEEKLDLIERSMESKEDFDEWCEKSVTQLIRVTRRMASKYTKIKIRGALHTEFEYIMEELLSIHDDVPDKEVYYNDIIGAIIATGRAKAFIVVVCRLIQHLAIDRLHVIGDIFDRGSSADQVMDRLARYHSVDIQWGNHDIDWMGAACGSEVCIASVIRISARYNNLSTLEDGYGINLVPLYQLALDAYSDDECADFTCEDPELEKSSVEYRTLTKVHKAIAVILMKLEGQLSHRRPEFNMEHRIFLDKIDYEKGTVLVEGKEYELTDKNFPTIDPKDPYKLRADEEKAVKKLASAFVQSEKLQRHVDFLYSKGSMYRIYNGNLLYHGCIPMDGDGHFVKVTLRDGVFSGRSLYDELEKWVRKARFADDPEEKSYGRDMMYFIWGNEKSPLFGKDKMTTFERYFVTDKSLYKEAKNAYYALIDNPLVVKRIFEEFDLDFETGHIINGHVPVKLKDGESPIHCDGKVLIIDGGFSKAYQKVTGIAGYTLVSNSRGMKLVALEPFVSVDDAVKNEYDIHSSTTLVDYESKRKVVADTDRGREMKGKIEDLKKLMDAYRSGDIRER